jgi:hypothetical protein
VDLLNYSPGLKLWIDDIRNPPDETWEWVTTSDAAIAVLKLFKEMPFIDREAASFDHDLGGDDTTRPVVIWMIENDFKFQNYAIHSANPVGRDWLNGMIERYL